MDGLGPRLAPNSRAQRAGAPIGRIDRGIEMRGASRDLRLPDSVFRDVEYARLCIEYRTFPARTKDRTEPDLASRPAGAEHEVARFLKLKLAGHFLGTELRGHVHVSNSRSWPTL